MLNATPPKNVLVQLNSLALGGTQLNALDLAIAVQGYGYRSTIYGPADTLPAAGPSLLDVATERGVRVESYTPSAQIIRYGARELSARVRYANASIVHAYGADAEPRAAYWGPCIFGRKAFVQTIYEMEVPTRTYRHTSLVVGTGYLADDLALRPGPTTLISPPVDTTRDRPDQAMSATFRDRLQLDPNYLLIVIVSRLDSWMKAHPIEVAMRSMPYLNELNAHLVIVGTGNESDRLRSIGSRINGIAENPMITFIGPMKDPRPAYAAADVVLGMGGSAARALAFGKPLVVQGELGTAELFSEGSADSLFRRSFWSPKAQANAPELLADTLLSVASSQVRADLGRFGRSFAVEHFGLEAMARRLANVYDLAIATYGRYQWAADLHLESSDVFASIQRRLPTRRAQRARRHEEFV